MQLPALKVLTKNYSIHKCKAGFDIPQGALQGEFYSIAATVNELSFVCESTFTLDALETNTGWSCIEVAGPLDFSLTGILAGISSTLANAGVSILAISSFDTDYILVKTAKLNIAKQVLSEAGYTFSSRQA